MITPGVQSRAERSVLQPLIDRWCDHPALLVTPGVLLLSPEKERRFEKAVEHKSGPRQSTEQPNMERFK
jgi:hypothetical protein